MLWLALLTSLAAKAGDLRPHVTAVLPNDRVTGRLVSDDGRAVVIDVGAGRRRTVTRSATVRVTVEQRAYEGRPGEVWLHDPVRVRYVVSPSAHRLRPGEFSWTQLEVLGSLFTVGLSEDVTFLAGAIVPLWLVPTYAGSGLAPTLHALFGASYARPLSDQVRVGVGSWVFALPFSRVVAAWNHVLLTLGDEETHVTFTAGLTGMTAGPSFVNFGAPTLSTAATFRVADHVSLLVEGWMYWSRVLGTSPSNSPLREVTSLAWVAAAAVRFVWEHWSLDLGVGVTGLVNLPVLAPTFGGAVPLPLLSFAYHSR